MHDAEFCADMFARLARVWERTLEYRGDRDRYLSDVGAATPAAASSSPAFFGGAGGGGDGNPQTYAFIDDDDDAEVKK